jgi:hypothetical protein
VRITTILARILALKQTRIVAFDLEPEGVMLEVKPSTRVPVCSGCFKRVHAVHDRYEGRRWRHLVSDAWTPSRESDLTAA